MRAVPKRAQEFAAGRSCARRALAEFGVPPVALAIGSDRRPVWPERFVGSIPHTQEFCAAIVAERTCVAALGVDTEVVGHVTTEVWSSICPPTELSWLDSLPIALRGAAVTRIFAAKEAFYRYQYTPSGEWLDFHDLCVDPLAWDSKQGKFAVIPTRQIVVQSEWQARFVGR